MILANSLKKCVSLLSISLGILTLIACSDSHDTSDNNNTNNAQLENQAIKATTEQSEPKQKSTTADIPVEINKSSPEVSKTASTNPEAEPETSDIILDAEPEQIQIEQQLATLQKRLNQNSQNNAALRQHIEILIKKVEENQQTIQKLNQDK